MDFSFLRSVRTASSEQWLVYESGSDNQVGSFDLHIKANDEVHSTLIITSEMDEDTIDQLIARFDEDVVDMADIERGNFFLAVYRGTELGHFKIEDVTEESTKS